MNYWKSIVESLPCVMIAINTERKIVAFNENALKQFQQTEQSFRNFSCIDFTSSITANMDILGLMKNRHYISALNQQINSV